MSTLTRITQPLCPLLQRLLLSNNLVLALEKGIKLVDMLARAIRKYEERISSIDNGFPEQEIKDGQKIALAKEETEK